MSKTAWELVKGGVPRSAFSSNQLGYSGSGLFIHESYMLRLGFLPVCDQTSKVIRWESEDGKVVVTAAEVGDYIKKNKNRRNI